MLNGNNKRNKMMVIIATIVAVITVAIAVFIIVGSKGRELKKQLSLGQKYLLDMNYEEAIAVFEKVLNIDPMNIEAYYGLADAYIGIDDLDSAKRILKKGIKKLSKGGYETLKLEAKLTEVEVEIELSAVDDAELFMETTFDNDEPIIQETENNQDKNDSEEYISGQYKTQNEQLSVSQHLSIDFNEDLSIDGLMADRIVIKGAYKKKGNHIEGNFKTIEVYNNETVQWEKSNDETDYAFEATLSNGGYMDFRYYENDYDYYDYILFPENHD